MADVPQQPAAPPQEVAQPAAEAAEPQLHPAEIRKLQKAAKAVQQELDAMKAERVKAEEAKLSEVEQLRKRIAEFDKVKANEDRYAGRLNAYGDALLSGLPEALRGKAQEKLEALSLAPDGRLDLLELFASMSAPALKEPPRPAPGARGPLSPSAPLTAASIAADRDALRRLTPEERQKLLTEMGGALLGR